MKEYRVNLLLNERALRFIHDAVERQQANVKTDDDVDYFLTMIERAIKRADDDKAKGQSNE